MPKQDATPDSDGDSEGAETGAENDSEGFGGPYTRASGRVYVETASFFDLDSLVAKEQQI